MNKDNLIGAIGILIPGSVYTLTLIEHIKPVLSIVALIISIAVGITVFILNVIKIIKNARPKTTETGQERGKQKA